jgi:hypothetical protein
MVMNTFEQPRKIIGASWGQSPDTSEAGGISTSSGVAKRDGLTGLRDAPHQGELT